MFFALACACGGQTLSSSPGGTSTDGAELAIPIGTLSRCSALVTLGNNQGDFDGTVDVVTSQKDGHLAVTLQGDYANVAGTLTFVPTTATTAFAAAGQTVRYAGNMQTWEEDGGLTSTASLAAGSMALVDGSLLIELATAQGTPGTSWIPARLRTPRADERAGARCHATGGAYGSCMSAGGVEIASVTLARSGAEVSFTLPSSLGGTDLGV